MDKRSSSPHPWGCFSPHRYSWHTVHVFPTPVGVFPVPISEVLPLFRLPHTRGGVSRITCILWTEGRSSPHPWGCFWICTRLFTGSGVFPTPVGVFLKSFQRFLMSECLPHTRGGVSEAILEAGTDMESSPHPWGCFPALPGPSAPAIVFPTPVGVFLSLIS